MNTLEAPIKSYSHLPLILILFLSTDILAKNISQESETKSLQFHCIQNILKHPFTKKHYPNLVSDKTSSLYYEFLTEIDQFCNCQSTIEKKEKVEQRKDYFNWSFKDKRISLEKEDLCIVKNFSDHAIQTIYTIVLDTKIRKQLSLRLKHRLPNSSYHTATESSVHTRLSCIEEKILKRCTKIKSLRTTYNCIQSSTDNYKEFNKIEQLCPQFQNEHKFAHSTDLI